MNQDCATNGTQQPEESKDDSLWPKDFGKLPVVPPVVILRHQAALFHQMTNEVLEGVVYSDEQEGGGIIHSLFLRAPRLNGYRYRLISLAHRIADPYPVRVVYDASRNYDGSDIRIVTWSQAIDNPPLADETALRERLRQTFNSEETLRLIRSLLAQSQVDVAA